MTQRGDANFVTAGLQGKVAIVTGAAAGIGWATARHVARSGAAIVVADRDGDGAERCATEIRGNGGRAVACRVDVASETAVIAMVATAVDRFGRLDILHNNAATTVGASIGADCEIASADPQLWLRMYEVNVVGAMLGCKHAIPVMSSQGGGSIVNTTSTAGLAAGSGNPSYGVNKAALILLTKQVATAYGRFGIRCNAVAPGLVLSEGVLAHTAESDLLRIASYSALGRAAQPEDIAAAVAFLASEQAALISGEVLSVDGGVRSALPYVLGPRDVPPPIIPR